jgi:hypothetical protein
MAALLALLSLAPAGLLRAAPTPCAPVARAAAGDCGGCCGDAPAAPVLDTVSCGCCAGAPAPAPEPAGPASSLVPLCVTREVVGFVAPTAARLALTLDARIASRDRAPPARLLHCVHLI